MTMRTTKKRTRTTNKRPDPVFSEKQQKAAVPLGMAAFLVVEKSPVCLVSATYCNKNAIVFCDIYPKYDRKFSCFPNCGGRVNCVKLLL